MTEGQPSGGGGQKTGTYGGLDKEATAKDVQVSEAPKWMIENILNLSYVSTGDY